MWCYSILFFFIDFISFSKAMDSVKRGKKKKECVETNLKDSIKHKRKGLQHVGETYCDVWFGDSGTDVKTGGGRGEAVKIFTWSDQDRQGMRRERLIYVVKDDM